MIVYKNHAFSKIWSHIKQRLTKQVLTIEQIRPLLINDEKLFKLHDFSYITY